MVNYDALGSAEYEEAKSAPVTSSKRIMTLDYPRLKAETGIEKIKLEASGEDDEPYLFSFLPFPITSNHPKHDQLKKVFKGADPIDWRLNLVFHKVSTPTGSYKVLCPTKNYGEPCPFCERKQELFAEHDGNFKAMSKSTQDEVKELNDTARDFFLILNHDDGKVYVMEYSTFYFGERLAKKMARSHRGSSNIILAHPGPDGYSLEFFIEASKIKDNRGRPVIGPIEEMEFVRRKEAIDEELLETLPPLDKYIKRYSYEDLEGMLDGTFFVSGSSEDEEEESGSDNSGFDFSEKSEEKSDTVSDVGVESKSRRRRSRGGEADDAPTSAPKEDVDEEPRIVIGKKPEPDEEDSREARRRRRRENRKSEEPECPAGGEFGKDIDNFDECEDCPIYEDCEKKYEENEILTVI